MHGGLHAVYASGRATRLPPSLPRPKEDQDPLTKCGTCATTFARPANVTKQFKSPFHHPTATSSSHSHPSSMVRAAPTIQTLQGQVQTLKQAIKIKSSDHGEDEEASLERLADKWTDVGRQVAWALWDYVKDLDLGTALGRYGRDDAFAGDDDGIAVGQKRGYGGGWDGDGPAGKRIRFDGEIEDGGEDAPVVQHTLGVMLRRLGIDPVTLGWDEEEGDFLDT